METETTPTILDRQILHPTILNIRQLGKVIESLFARK